MLGLSVYLENPEDLITRGQSVHLTIDWQKVAAALLLGECRPQSPLCALHAHLSLEPENC